MRAAVAGQAIPIRNPEAVRPWQHVLNPLSGYLLLAQAIWDSADMQGGWNFALRTTTCAPCAGSSSA